MAVTAHTMGQIGWQPQKCHFLPVLFKYTTLKGIEWSFIMSCFKKYVWQVENPGHFLSCLQHCDFCLILKRVDPMWISGCYILFRNSKKCHFFLNFNRNFYLTYRCRDDLNRKNKKNSIMGKCCQKLALVEWKIVFVNWKTLKMKSKIIKTHCICSFWSMAFTNYKLQFMQIYWIIALCTVLKSPDP